MNLKQNKNYFTKGDGLKLVGIGLVVLGVLLYFFGMGYWSYVLMLTVTPTGIILFFVGVSGRSSDADMDACIALQMESFAPNPEEDKQYGKRIQKHISPETVEGYEYEDGLMLKKAKDGKIRSSEYTRTVIYQLTDALYLASRRVSLISEEVCDRTVEIPYDAVIAIDVQRENATMQFGKRRLAVKKTYLVVTYGRETFRAPLQDDTRADHLVEKLNKTVAEARKAKTDGEHA